MADDTGDKCYNDRGIQNVWIPDCDAVPDPCHPGEPNYPLTPPPVCIPVFITNQPEAPEAPVDAFTEVTFTVVNNTDATGPVTYQWYQEGSPLVGETSATLTFTAQESDGNTTFQVVILNPCGEATSASLLLLVDDYPPECYPYACDSFEGALLDIVDDLWPVYIGDDNTLENVLGGDQLNISLGPASYFTTDPVITNACYDSWRRQSVGGGTAARGAYIDYPRGTPTRSKTASIGILSRFISNLGGASGLGHEMLAVNFLRVDEANPSGFATGVYAKLQISQAPSNPSLRLQINGSWDAGTTVVEQAISDLTNYKWFGLEVTSEIYDINTGPYTWGQSVSAKVFTEDGLTLETEVSLKATAPWQAGLCDGYIEIFAGDSINGFASHLYHKGGKLETTHINELGIAFSRNIEGYTPPEWCPIIP